MGALLLTLDDPILTASTTANYTLTSAPPFTFLANTKYWFAATNGNSVNLDSLLRWHHNTSAAASTFVGVTVPANGNDPSPLGLFNGGSDTLADPTTWTTKSTVYNDFRLTVVPEPSSMDLIGLAGLAGLIGYRRRR